MALIDKRKWELVEDFFQFVEAVRIKRMNFNQGPVQTPYFTNRIEFDLRPTQINLGRLN